jgi:hypothetical protein
MRGDGRSRRGTEGTEVPAAVPGAQVGAKVELSQKEDQP